MPVPNLVAKRRDYAKFVIQADFSNPVNVAQALAELGVHRVVQAPLKGGDDLLAAQAIAPGPTHRNNERMPEALVVGAVELLQSVKLLWAAFAQPSAALLTSRLGGQGLAHHRPPGKLGMGSHQCELGFTAGSRHHLCHGMLELRQGHKRPLLQGLLGNPWRVFVQPTKLLQQPSARRGVELVQAQCHAQLLTVNRGGCYASGEQCQCGGKPRPGPAGRCSLGIVVAR